MTATPTLYHGPGALAAAHTAATAKGKIVPLAGNGGIRKDDVRELVGVLNSRPMGVGPFGVVVGPLDEMRPEVSDVLLKTLEEPIEHGVEPYLWAWDLGGVSPTVRSRCRGLYVGGEDLRLQAYDGGARTLLKAWSGRDWTTLVEYLGNAKGDEALLVGAVYEVAARSYCSGDLAYERLLLALRPLFGGAQLTVARVVAAFMEAADE